MGWREVRYGDRVAVAPGFMGVGSPPRGVHLRPDGTGLFVELVKPENYQAVLDRAVAPDARALPVRVNAQGRRDCSLASVLESSREEYVSDFITPRTALWCLQHLAAEGIEDWKRISSTSSRYAASSPTRGEWRSTEACSWYSRPCSSRTRWTHAT